MENAERPKKKKDWSIGILAAVLIPLLGITVTLFTVFYEKPKTFLPNPLLDQAEVLLVEEKYDEAIPKFDQAAAVEADNPRIWLGKYAAMELSDRHEEAVQALQEGTEHVKKRATGGKEIRAVLFAAEISPEEGLAAVADSYRSFSLKSKAFDFKTLALRLLQVLVKVFEGAEQFVKALAEVTEEIRLEASATTEVGGVPIIRTPVPEGTRTADQIQSAIDALKDAPISTDEYTQIEAFVEKPVASFADMISHYALDKEGLFRNFYNSYNASVTYEEFLRLTLNESTPYFSVAEVHDIKRLSDDGAQEFISIYKNETWSNDYDIVANALLPLDGVKNIYRITMTQNENGNMYEQIRYVVNLNGNYKFVLIHFSSFGLFSGIS